MSGFHLEPAADLRLDEIFTYTYERWGSEQAGKYIRELFDRFAAIDRHEIPWRQIPADFGIEGYYYRHDRHFIYWRERADGHVAIVSILHERMYQRLRLAFDLGEP